MDVKQRIRALARQAGFPLCGFTAAAPLNDHAIYTAWLEAGMGGEMHYLAGSRALLRRDPRQLFPAARSILCVGMLYNSPRPYSTQVEGTDRGWISRYAWGEDYHRIVGDALRALAFRMREELPWRFEWKACVDTSPLLERSYARQAGLGWIGRNTCLINQPAGSWFFLGELLLSLELEPDLPPPDRCGSCRRCIDACPTGAIVRTESGWLVDSRLCISYFTIELRGAIPEHQRASLGRHIFGCDICQDVCPWNRRAAVTSDARFHDRLFAPPLQEMASLDESAFAERFHSSPVRRARYTGFLRNVAVAMGNSRRRDFLPLLKQLAARSEDEAAAHADWALRQLE